MSLLIADFYFIADTIYNIVYSHSRCLIYYWYAINRMLLILLLIQYIILYIHIFIEQFTTGKLYTVANFIADGGHSQ